MSGVAIPGHIEGGDGIHVTPEGKINAGQSTPALPGSGAIGTQSVAMFPVPEDTTVFLELSLAARLVAAAATSVAGASAAYKRWAVVRRDGAAAPVLTVSATVVDAEEASGTLLADWSVTVTVSGNSVLLSFVIANNAYGGAGNVRLKGNIAAALSVDDATP